MDAPEASSFPWLAVLAAPREEIRSRTQSIGKTAAFFRRVGARLMPLHAARRSTARKAPDDSARGGSKRRGWYLETVDNQGVTCLARLRIEEYEGATGGGAVGLREAACDR